MVNDCELRNEVEQRDLGTTMYNSLKVESRVERMVKKDFGVLAFINQSIVYRSWVVMLNCTRYW